MGSLFMSLNIYTSYIVVKEGREMNHIYNIVRSKPDERDFKTKLSPHSSIVIPPAVDLRPNCPPIFDQGNLGSCSANAGSAAYTMWLKQKTIIFSRLFLYYCERVLERDVPEDAGAKPIDICKAVNKYGICEEKLWPYDISKFAVAPTQAAMDNAKKYPKPPYVRLFTLEEVKQHIALMQGPVMVGIDVFESLESPQTGKTGIIAVPDTTKEAFLGGHEILIVGYYDKMTANGHTGYLIIRNSWGTGWGDKGYGYLPYDFCNKGLAFDYLAFQ